MPQVGIFILILLSWTLPSHSDTRTALISETAAERFEQKIRNIMDFAPENESGEERFTRITDEELNSYLSRDSNKEYTSCLRTLRMTFQQDALEGLASVDFDCLKEMSWNSAPGYIAQLFTGTHVITCRGKIISDNGEARLQLEQARFDDSRLPNFLVEQAVEAVCENQKLDFNPLQPTRLPYSIKRITVHPGYIVVYQ